MWETDTVLQVIKGKRTTSFFLATGDCAGWQVASKVKNAEVEAKILSIQAEHGFGYVVRKNYN